MRKIATFSIVCAVVYSAFKIKTAAQVWMLPASFLGFCLLFALLYWLFLGLYVIYRFRNAVGIQNVLIDLFHIVPPGNICRGRVHRFFG